MSIEKHEEMMEELYKKTDVEVFLDNCKNRIHEIIVELETMTKKG